MTDKQATLQLIEKLPESATFEDVLYEVYVLERITKGLAEAKGGQLVSHEHVKKDLAEWLKSVGQ